MPEVLIWTADTPLDRYRRMESEHPYDIARLHDLGLFPGAEKYYSLEGSNLMVKDPAYSNAGKYTCSYRGLGLDDGVQINYVGHLNAEAIVLGKI